MRRNISVALRSIAVLMMAAASVVAFGSSATAQANALCVDLDSLTSEEVRALRFADENSDGFITTAELESLDPEAFAEPIAQLEAGGYDSLDITGNCTPPTDGTDDGATDDGATDDGATDDGATDDGATDDGAVGDGVEDLPATGEGTTVSQGSGPAGLLAVASVLLLFGAYTWRRMAAR